jgi:DNA-directed RNA polymerase specialized sigma24 family protein
METGKRMAETLYLRYECLAKKYAHSLNDFDKIAFTREDLIQEFRIKIFLSIKAYGRKWKKYRDGEVSKPIPLRHYLESACRNKCKDFMKYITRESCKCSIDEVNYDFGVNEDSYINVSTNTFVVHDIDLLEGLTGIQRSIYSLYLRGHNKVFLSKVYKSKMGVEKSAEAREAVEQIIEDQKNFLLGKYGNDLTQKTTVFSSYQIED